jgi:hypothetical protein
MATKFDFELDQGTDFELELTFYDDTEALEDLTGRAYAGQARKAFTDASPIFSFSFLIKDQSLEKGKLLVSVSKTDTSPLALKEATKYFYDIEETVSAKTIRILEGTVKVQPEVTK